MRIIENNSNQLILRSNFFLVVIFGLFFIFGCFSFTYLAMTSFSTTNSVSLHCEHVGENEVTCELSKKLLGIIPIRRCTIANIQHAIVEEKSNNDSNSTYRIIFITANGNVPLTDTYTSGYDAKANAAKQINDFIGIGQSNTLNIKENFDWEVLIFLVIFGSTGILIALFAKRITVEMNHSEGILRIRKGGLVGGNQEEYLLREIEDVYLQSGHSSRGGRNYRIVFRINNGDEIPLMPIYTSGVENKQRIIEAMKDFLSSYQHQHPLT